MDKKDLPRLIVAAALILIAGIATYFVTKNNEEKENNNIKDVVVDVHKNDNILFGEYYNIDSDNPFIILTEEELLEFLENGSGILFLGFPECPFCKAAIPVLNEVLIENHVQQAYYFNPKEIRASETENYKKIVEYLSESLLEDADGNKRVYVPDVYLISKGKVIGNHLDTVEGFDPKTNPSLSEEQQEELRNIYQELIDLDEVAAGCEVRC